MQAFAVLLGYVAACFTLRPSRRGYLAATVLYSVLVGASSYARTWSLFFGLSMSESFNSGSVSAYAWTIPFLIIAFLAVPAVALYPFVPLGIARLVGWVFFAALTPLILLFGAVYLDGDAELGFFLLPAGFEIVVLALLWLRIYELRVRTTPASPGNVA